MTKTLSRRDFVRSGAAVGLAAVAAPGTVFGQPATGSGREPGSASSAQGPSMSRQFARWGARLKYEDLPPEVVDKVKALMLHALTSAGLYGSNPWVKEAVRLVKMEEGKPDGATILVDGGKATRIGAAHANNEILHASGLVDSYRMRTHPGPVLISVALANAELEKKNGKDVITALAAGYEFQASRASTLLVEFPAG